MNPIPQQLLIYGTVLFLLGLLIGVAVPVLRNPRMGMSAHVAGMQSGMTLWALGLMWQRLALAAGMQRATHVLAVLGLYLIFAALVLAALWGTSRATPIAGAGHQGSRLREATVTGLMAGGSLAILAAVVLVLWGLCAWKG
jgi:hydroxylaminobenzene mutase